MAKTEYVYGYFHGGDPRKFSPDHHVLRSPYGIGMYEVEFED